MRQVRGGGGHRQEGAQGGHDAARGGPRPRPPQCPRRRAVRRVGPPREHGLTRPGPARAWHEPALSGVAELRASSASAPRVLFGWARPIGMVGTRPARRITGITGAPLGGCGRAGWRRWGGHCGVFGGGSVAGATEMLRDGCEPVYRQHGLHCWDGGHSAYYSSSAPARGGRGAACRG